MGKNEQILEPGGTETKRKIVRTGGKWCRHRTREGSRREFRREAGGGTGLTESKKSIKIEKKPNYAADGHVEKVIDKKVPGRIKGKPHFGDGGKWGRKRSEHI